MFTYCCIYLEIVDIEKEFVICTNIFLECLGGVLMQEDHVVAYETHKLKDNKRNYVVYNLELVALIHTLKMWIQHLIGEKFT